MVLSLTENNIIFIFMLWSPLKAEYALGLANLVVATIWAWSVPQFFTQINPPLIMSGIKNTKLSRALATGL